MVVAAELTIINSYPTSASGIIILLKTPTKYREFFPTLFIKKQPIFSLFLILSGRLQLQWARSIQPNFPEISVQNSMDRFGPTGKVSEKRVHLLRWSSFPGRTGWNFG